MYFLHVQCVPTVWPGDGYIWLNDRKNTCCVQPANASCEEPVNPVAAKRPAFLNIMLYDKPVNYEGSNAQCLTKSLEKSFDILKKSFI